jgi:hypothetical protein
MPELMFVRNTETKRNHVEIRQDRRRNPSPKDRLEMISLPKAKPKASGTAGCEKIVGIRS